MKKLDDGFILEKFKWGINVIILLIVCLFLYSCSGQNKISGNQSRKSLYRIKKVKSVNDWNIIYATKRDSTYKIISKKTNDRHTDCRVIKKGQYYDLALNSRKNNPPVINGVKVNPVNVECYRYDNSTTICIEPKRNIYDLHDTPNILGLCYSALVSVRKK